MAVNKRQRMSGNEIKALLDAKDVVQNRFPDVSLLDRMGLSAVTQEMFDKAGLGKFLGKKAPMYPTFTKVFLKSLEVYRDDDTKMVCKIGWTANGRSYDLTRLQIAEALGIEDGGNEDETVTREVVLEWWRQGSGEQFFPKKTSDTGLAFPPWRIIHKVIAMCFLNRAENSKISLNQLYYIYAFSAECSSYVPDWVSIFADACRESYSNKAGDIAVGGMISLLAERVGCVPRGNPIPGNSLYDLEWCSHHSWIRPNGRKLRYKFGRGFTIDFPREEPLLFGTWEEMYTPPDVIPPGRNIPLPAPSQVPAPERQRRRTAASPASSSQGGGEEQEGEKLGETWQDRIAAQYASIEQHFSGLEQQMGCMKLFQQGMDRRLQGVESEQARFNTYHQQQCDQFRGEVAGIRYDLTDIRTAQTRAQEGWQSYYDYQQCQWVHYWGQHPPPPPGQ